MLFPTSSQSPFIVDSHHKVLTAWANFRNSLSKPPRLITLDHHTDTSRPFRRIIAKTYEGDLSVEEFGRVQESYLKTIDYKKPRTVEEGVSKLNNDEHIVAAIKTEIISSAFVVAHNAVKTDLEIYNEHRIVCFPVPESCSKGEPDCDIVLESSFLDQAISAFDEVLIQQKESSLLSEPFILDLDLDYLNTFKSVTPENSKTFQKLAKNAGLITIATEPDYVQSCAIDSGLTSEHLLDKIKILLP